MIATNGLNAAKQGNPEAIAALMNKSLQPKGITVKATVTGKCLTVIAEAKTAPEQSALVDFICQGITNLNPQSIERIVIQGKALDQKQIAWREAVELKPSFSNGSNGSNGSSSSSTTNGSKSSIVVSNTKSKNFSERLGWLTHIQNYANTALLAGILLTLLGIGWSANRPKPIFWEYKVEGVKDAIFDVRMQQAGADGWELASARRAVSGEGEYSEGLYEVIFRRQITKAQAKQNVKDATAQIEAAELQIQETLAKLQVSTINRGQQGYFVEHTAFAPSLAGLDMEFETDTENYVYAMTLERKSKVIVTATAKNDQLKSFTGAVVYAGRYNTEAILCQTESPSKTAPAAPTLNGTELQCAPGSVEPD